MDEPSPAEQRRVSSDGVIVVGMHRSGTSAVTRILHFLGLRIPSGDDLMGPDPSNPSGYFESRLLRFLNDELLLSLGGTWSAPPVLGSGWEGGPVASSLVETAGEAFLRAYPDGPWVWKDPRLCLTIPFWDRVLGRRPVVALFRHPGEVVRSLAARREHNPSLGLALWFRYSLDMLLNLEGRPVYISDWARVRDDPQTWCTSLRDWLSELAPISSADPARAAEAVDPSLSTIAEREAGSELPLGREDWVLLDRLHALEGPHTSLRGGDLPAEPAGRLALLEERRQFEVATLLRLGGAAHEREVLEDYVRLLEQELERKIALIDRLRAPDEPPPP